MEAVKAASGLARCEVAPRVHEKTPPNGLEAAAEAVQQPTALLDLVRWEPPGLLPELEHAKEAACVEGQSLSSQAAVLGYCLHEHRCGGRATPAAVGSVQEEEERLRAVETWRR